MEVLQYIYTSWKNGGSNGGYMIYSKSEGITDAECDAIKLAMRYLPPSDLPLVVTPEQIADEFPYAFSYFILPSGRGCIAQSTYLGRDYSTRFGNYIIYAMVFDLDELPCRPAEFFAEAYIKTAMTEEELEATPPVPPLPPMTITEYGSVINDDQLNEFVFDKEEELAHVLAMLLEARSQDIPLYLNDSRENLVLWSAAIQRMFPTALAKRFTFNTYMPTSRLTEKGWEYCLLGVRPDDYFSYSTQSQGGRHLEIDFVGGHMSEGIVPGQYEQAMASAMAMDFEEIDQFGEFLETTSFDRINTTLRDAYIFYRLLRYDEYEHSEENLKAVLSFGTKYCNESDNSDVGSKLLVKLQESGEALSVQTVVEFWNYTCRYSNYMIFTLYDLVQETLFQYAGETTAPCTVLEGVLEKLRQDTAQQYQEYLAYVNTPNNVEHLLLYLKDHTNVFTNLFYAEWILKSYSLADGLNTNQPIAKLFKALLDNISRTKNSETVMIKMLFAADSSAALFQDMLNAFLGAIKTDDREKLDAFCRSYIAESAELSERQVARIEQMLMEIPAAAPIASRLFAQKIAAAKDPEEEFWRFYEHQRSRLLSDSGFSIGPMIMECLNHVDEKSRTKVTVEMLKRVDIKLFNNANLVRRLTDIISACSVKELVKMDQTVLKRTYQLREKLEGAEMDRLKAVLTGEALDANYDPDKRPVPLSAHMQQVDFSLETWSRSDYEDYVKKYFDVYFAFVHVKEDIPVLAKIFFHGQHFAEFTDDYTSALKKMQKKEQSRWLRIVAWTCVYVIGAPANDQAAEGLYRPMIHYLKSFDEEELKELQREIGRDAPKAQCDQFFDEVQRKEGFSGKISGLFRKK